MLALWALSFAAVSESSDRFAEYPLWVGLILAMYFGLMAGGRLGPKTKNTTDSDHDHGPY